jgi:hypothetical protein
VVVCPDSTDMLAAACVWLRVCSTRFEVAPNTLVLCLKRFGTGRFGKINKVLVYGEKLDLGPFMAQGAMDDGGTTYTLTGVVVHLDQVRRDRHWDCLRERWWYGHRIIITSCCWIATVVGCRSCESAAGGHAWHMRLGCLP